MLLNLYQVVDSIKTGRISKIAVLSGAGISCASGIPDFRSPGGLYETLKPQLLTATQMQKDRLEFEPTLVVDFELFSVNQFPHLEVRRPFILGVAEKRWKPTAAHFFCQLLSDKGLLQRLYTQNIDGLDYQTSLDPSLICPVHGSIFTCQCEFCGDDSMSFDEFQEKLRSQIRNIYDPSDTTAPSTSTNILCPKCQRAGMKPSTVLYGRSLPQAVFQNVRKDFPSQVDLLLIIGTSLTVSPANTFVNKVSSNVPRILINRERAGEDLGMFLPDENRDIHLEGDCDEGILTLAAMLGWLPELYALRDRMCPASAHLVSEHFRVASAQPASSTPTMYSSSLTQSSHLTESKFESINSESKSSHDDSSSQSKHLQESQSKSIPPSPASVIFVCSSSTARSPMAEAFGKQWVQSRGLEGQVQIISRALTSDYDPADSPASEYCVSIMRNDYSFDLSSHRSRLLSLEDVQQAKAIIGISKSHQEKILDQYSHLVPELSNKVFRFSQNIIDPWRLSFNDYRICANQMRPLVEEVLQQVLSTTISPLTTSSPLPHSPPPQSTPALRTIIFVCTSNTCRSPMAEAFGKQWVQSRGLEGQVQIISRALTSDYEPPNSPASENGVLIMGSKFSLDTSSHRSRLLSLEDVQHAQAIVGVSKSHRDWILQQFSDSVPGLSNKVFAFSRNVPDPWHQSLSVYDACAKEIQPLVGEILEKLTGQDSDRK